MSSRAPLCLFAILILCGCSKSSSDSGSTDRSQDQAPEAKTAAKTEAKTGPQEAPAAGAGRWYRAELEKPDDPDLEPIPFFLHVPLPGAGAGKGGDDRKVLIRHGDIDIDAEHTWQGDRLTIRLPLFHTAIDATAGADGALTGTWSSESRTWGKANLTFRARPIDAPTPVALFAPTQGAPGADASGVWKLKMADQSIAKLIVESRPGGGVVGSYNASGGNIIRLAGTVSGATLRMSGFEGTMAFFLTATIKGDGIDGTWIPVRDKTWPEEFVGDRVADFDLEGGARVVEGETTLEIPGVDLGAYKGKPTIVEIAGSWCTNCMYAAPFMVEMYEKYHSRGLEIVTLTYEFTDDDAYNRQQAEAFTNKYGVTWQVIPVAGELDSAADILPPTLDGIDLSGLPLAVFLRPDGTIHRVHSGFPGTGTVQYKALTAQYESWIKELLALHE